MGKKRNGVEIQRVSKDIINTIEIPKEGFLGLLAFGDLGIIAWRKARDLKIKASNKSQANKKQDNDE